MLILTDICMLEVIFKCSSVRLILFSILFSFSVEFLVMIHTCSTILCRDSTSQGKDWVLLTGPLQCFMKASKVLHVFCDVSVCGL